MFGEKGIDSKSLEQNTTTVVPVNLTDIPETIQSAQKLLEIAKNVNSSLESLDAKRLMSEKPDF